MTAEALPRFPLSAKVTALRGVGPVFAEAFEAAGIATDNPKLKAEGQDEKLTGKIQKKIGQVEKVIGK